MQSKTQWHSNVLKLLKLLQKSSQASKTFFQLLQIKRLQLKLTNNLQNSQHQVPKTWVKQHPKTPKTTKTNENSSPSSSMHKLVPFGSKLVPMGSIVHRSVPTNLKWFPNCLHAHALFQDGFKDVQIGSRWFSTLYIHSPNFHTPSWTVVLHTEVPIAYHAVCKAMAAEQRRTTNHNPITIFLRNPWYLKPESTTSHGVLFENVWRLQTSAFETASHLPSSSHLSKGNWHQWFVLWTCPWCPDFRLLR